MKVGERTERGLNAFAFNKLVSAAAQNQRLGGTIRGGSGSHFHHWKVKGGRAGDDAQRQWRIFVGPGTVNDRMAAISYLREDDPRGWTMPEDYRAIPLMKRIYGDNFRIVDRLLTDRDDPPHLLIEAPALESATDPGDFWRVPDNAQRPRFFRTAARWEKELWRLSIFVTANPLRYTRVENRTHFPLPTRNTRFRVAAAPKMPTRTVGVSAGGNHELARLYLLREPGRIERDELWVQQRCFWSLGSTNVEPYLDFYAGLAEVVEFATLAVLPLGATGLALGTGLLAAEALLTDILLAEIAASFEAGASVEFWSAA